MDFNVRSDSIDVEQIMEQIRTRIREKRGVDYTEQQLRELAAVKLEKFLDPRGVRSDLLEQFRQHQPRYEPPIVPSFPFEDTTMFETHRGALRFIRRLLSPILKLFFNPNALIHALHTQSEINKVNLEREVTRENQRRDMDALYFEVIHNLVFELTRTGIEVKNLKMRVESLASRLEFSERRARALESVVVYKPVGRRSGRAGGAAKRAASEERREQSAAAGRRTAAPAYSVAAGRTTGRSGWREHNAGRDGFAGDRRRARKPGPTKPKAAAAAWAPRRRPRVRPDGPFDRPGARARRRATRAAGDGRAILACGLGTCTRAPGPSIRSREANHSRPSLGNTTDQRPDPRRARGSSAGTDPERGPVTDSAASDPDHGSDPDQQ